MNDFNLGEYLTALETNSITLKFIQEMSVELVSLSLVRAELVNTNPLLAIHLQKVIDDIYGRLAKLSLEMATLSAYKERLNAITLH